MGTSGSGTIEAISRRKALPAAKRQHRSVEFKLQIVEESLVPGASVARVARAHGVNANQVFTWRRLYRQGRMGSVSRAMPGLLAVQVREPAVAPRVTETDRMSCGPSAERAGTIQIELPKGRVRLNGSVDPETLRVVLEALRG
jgi:transposase